jgi:hypothetical protein
LLDLQEFCQRVVARAVVDENEFQLHVQPKELLFDSYELLKKWP